MLTDPTGAASCYVGISKDAHFRYLQHLANSDIQGNPRSRKCNWIRMLLDRGLKPVLNILDAHVPTGDARQAEKDAIAMVRAIRGRDCLNKETV